MVDKWQKTALGELLSFANGKSSPERSDDLPYPVYGSNGVIGFAGEFNAEENTIIIGRVGSYCGSLYFSDEKCWVTDNAIRANAQSGNDSHFLYYLLSNLDLNRWRTGSGQPLLTQTTLSSIDVLVPFLSEQRAIAEILGSLDDKIELNRQMNATLEAIARAIFTSWFVDFDPVHAKAQGEAPAGMDAATAALFPDAFVESELGPIPAGWDVTSALEEFDVNLGQSPPGSTYNEEGEGLPFYQGSKDFAFRYPEYRVYCTEPKRLAQPNDTLISVRAPVGDVNMAFEKCCIGRGLWAVRHKSGSRSYTYYAMKKMKEYFDRFNAEGTVFGSLSKRKFKRIPVLSPPTVAVERFEEIVSPMDEMIENNMYESRTLAELRDTLLPKLISGELRVPEKMRQD